MKTILLITFSILCLTVDSQNQLKIDTSLSPGMIVCQDTSYWFNGNDTTEETLIPYPNNSYVTFLKGLDVGDTIQNCKAKIGHDTLYISIFTISFGLRIYLEIIVVNETIDTKLIYDQSNFSISSMLKTDNCLLNLNKQKFHANDMLVGNISLSFSGKVWDMNSNKDRKVKGQLSGLFKSNIE